MQARFVFSIPYTDQYLPSTLHYPVHLWVNHKTDFVRVDVDSDEYVSGVKKWGLDSSISREVCQFDVLSAMQRLPQGCTA